MVTAEKFHTNYDGIVPLICKPYGEYIQRGALEIPEDAGSVCDVGIGTGNFSLAVKRRLPGVNLYGVDIDPSFTQVAREKLRGLDVRHGDLSRIELPKAEYFISSLTMHNVPREERENSLLRVAYAGRSFINFDFLLSGGRTKSEAIKKILEFSKNSFPEKESLENIAREIDLKDDPISLEDERKIYESRGLRFRLIKNEFPFALYRIN